MSPLNIALVVVWLISGVAASLLILMHSGKGTGVSDMIASSMYNSNAGSGVWEKNLDRLTIFFSVLFILCVIIMMVTFPQGSV